MIVKDFIEKLKLMPQNLEVVIKHEGYYADKLFIDVDDPVVNNECKIRIVQVGFAYCEP